MEPKITEIAVRIKELRSIVGLSVDEMVRDTGVSEEIYLEYEEGKRDFSFTFLYKCAESLGVDIIELLTGENPHLSGYTVVRKGIGLPIKRREGFEYYHLAHNFKNKIAEPFIVRAPYRAEELNKPVELNTHAGQEFDYVISGALRFVFEGHVEELTAGDSVYYNSGRDHGMIAIGGQECVFLALVMKEDTEHEKYK